MDSCSLEECNQEGSIVVTYAPVFVRSCDEHYNHLYKKYLGARRKVKCTLGQVVDRWVKPDGSIGKITTGKASEIENRTITPEGEVINKQSGKPAQY